MNKFHYWFQPLALYMIAGIAVLFAVMVGDLNISIFQLSIYGVIIIILMFTTTIVRSTPVSYLHKEIKGRLAVVLELIYILMVFSVFTAGVNVNEDSFNSPIILILTNLGLNVSDAVLINVVTQIGVFFLLLLLAITALLIASREKLEDNQTHYAKQNFKVLPKSKPGDEDKDSLDYKLNRRT